MRNQAVTVRRSQAVFVVFNAHWPKGVTSDYFPSIQWHVILHTYSRLGRFGHGYGLAVSTSTTAGDDKGNRCGKSRQLEPDNFMTHSMSSLNTACASSEH